MIYIQSRLNGSASRSCLNVHIMDIDVNPDPKRLWYSGVDTAILLLLLALETWLLLLIGSFPCLGLATRLNRTNSNTCSCRCAVTRPVWMLRLTNMCRVVFYAVKLALSRPVWIDPKGLFRPDAPHQIDGVSIV